MPEISCKIILSNSFPLKRRKIQHVPECTGLAIPRHHSQASRWGFSSRRKARPTSSNDSERPEIEARWTKVFYCTQLFSLVYCSAVNFDLLGSRKEEGKVFILFLHNLRSIKVVLVLVSVFMCQKWPSRRTRRAKSGQYSFKRWSDSRFLIRLLSLVCYETMRCVGEKHGGKKKKGASPPNVWGWYCTLNETKVLD